MKNFQKFLEEITIKGNQGIPGEDGNRNDPKYLTDVEARAKQRLGVTGREFPHQMETFGREIGQLLGRSQGMTRGREEPLEQLAERIIRANYEGILHDVTLDIKMIRPGEVKQFMDDEEEGEPGEIPQYKNLKDPQIKKEVDKAKIANAIIQGEAKNTKNILHLPEVMEGLVEIFGQRTAAEVFSIWVRISSLADKMDWIVPINIKSDMMEQQPEGMAGAVKVDWPKPPKDEKPKEEKEYKEKEPVEAELTGPVIKARGVDFPMLLHETVKGIYELISAEAIPDDEKLAKIIQLNISSFADEAEDFRYGPEIAADLRDFVNESPNIDKYPNLREFFYGKMVHRDTMTAGEFLKLMKGILSKKPEARAKVDSMINEIIKELDKWELGEVLGHDGPEIPEDSDTAVAGHGEEDDELSKLMKQSAEINAPKVEKEDDYSTWSKRKIQDEIDSALDNEDFDRVRMLSNLDKFKNEGKIYLRELEIINERVNLHTK